MKKLLALSLTAAVTSVSFASIVSTSGSLVEVAKPSDATLHTLESNTDVRVWLESTQILNSEFNGLDASGPGAFISNSDLNGGSIAGNSLVSSYMVHFDPADNQSNDYEGSVTFSKKILGVIVKDASLDASDSLFGGGTTYYTGNNRGWESQEDFWVSADGFTLTVDGRASAPMDEYRVITEGVPEPATMSLLGLGAAAIAARRRKKA